MFLGIDPGVRKLGFALIDKDLQIIQSGILLQDQKSPTRDDQYQRMVNIMEFFTQLYDQYKQQLRVVSVEQLFFTRYNQSNAEFVYGIRGALIAFFKQKGCKIKEYTPIELKKNITGNGKAQKQLMQQMIKRLFQLQNTPDYDDAADALGLAYLASK